jgi:hypothetical protein
MEHPTGDFTSAIDAMADAIGRLGSLPDWSSWITFCAQGMGQRPDSYAFSEVRLLGDRIDIGDTSLNTKAVCAAAGLPSDCITLSRSHYITTSLSARQTAQLLDSIFRHHAHIKPFPDEDDDYAVGAEW